jgi:molecular chaperone GrpE
MAPEPESGAAAREREGADAQPSVAAEGAVSEATAAAEPSQGEDLAARIAALEEELARAREQAAAQLKEAHDRYLRAAADLDNFRKRAQRERDEVQRFGVERLLKDLLPVVDNLDRALAAAPGDDPLAHGVRLVRKVLEEALAKHGVEVFSAHGVPFDPRLHEALAQLETPDSAPGTVVAEHGRGFMLNGRLLRPALVAVAAAQPEPEPDVEAASAESAPADAPPAPPAPPSSGGEG